MIQPVEVTITMSNGVTYTIPVDRVLEWSLDTVVQDVYAPIVRRTLSVKLNVGGLIYAEEKNVIPEVKMIADSQTP